MILPMSKTDIELIGRSREREREGEGDNTMSHQNLFGAQRGFDVIIRNAANHTT
jgi:hypothetical protein